MQAAGVAGRHPSSPPTTSPASALPGQPPSAPPLASPPLPGATDPVGQLARHLFNPSTAPGTEQPGRAAVPQGPPGGPQHAGAGAWIDRLLALVQAGLARIQTQQAASLPGDAPADRPVWQFELPLTIAGTTQDLSLRIERRDGAESGSAGQDGGACWTVALRFALGEYGRVHARVSLADNRVSSTFWCEQPKTERRFSGGLTVLRQALERSGLEVTDLRSVVGQPLDPVELPHPAAAMLDTRA
jgi:hypothetical protein